jgi:hypothetical protein
MGDRVTDATEVKKLRKRTSNFARVYSLGREPAPAAATVVRGDRGRGVPHNLNN